MTVQCRRITFAYETMSTALLEDLTFHFGPGWTGIVGPNGAGKTTILKLATGRLRPQKGEVRTPGDAIYCPQRTDHPPALLETFLEATDGAACALRGRLHLESDWAERWTTLSHGERKRAQIGVALWQEPGVLALDEPTNHIDTEARALLSGALRSYPGVGLLVSHDRQLLDMLCSQCLHVDPPDAVMRPGGYTTSAAQAREDEGQAREQLDQASQDVRKVEREAARRRETASRSHRERSKRGLPIKDHDARFNKNLARYSGKDGAAGRRTAQLEGRAEQARTRRDSIRVKKTYDTGIWIPGGTSSRNRLFHLPAGALALGQGRRLAFPDLSMAPRDRVALTGPNGAGKSTMIRHIVRHLSLAEERVTYLPQEIDLDTSRDVLRRVDRLGAERKGDLMTIVSRLGSRPRRLMETEEPSPGEIRKLLLALGIQRVPHLIIMDEPTNHLDLPSIECLEAALRGCPCGLLLVSHDRVFLDALATIRWRISPEDQDNITCRLVRR